MVVYFIDSSALVKRYVNETGSAWILGLFNPILSNEIFIGAITGVEIIAAISRRTRGESLSSSDATTLCNQFRNDYQTDYQVVEITDNIVTSGMRLAETYGLRGYDAIQLAVASAIHRLCLANSISLIFVSADNELNAAALRENMVVDNPNKYP
ncbi:nucleic acid-binding protein [Scytonema hofmannii PCC 7110]|uniref:Nucleic acid-binding protein n=1 Tax=Scytonema hofmannii PCC 7110 TaxID=128403 RepID=A0A139X226_9CYAN|nr:type II toxin-antitoxin system VapC family toxin [Scytonema hofmannii]KYC38748.1 nucleic acid-binding protein [Scytonema hofmannii PCC 7110]